MLLDLGQSNLYCWAWNRIYLKANGRVPCWCDFGEPHTLSKFTIGKDFVLDITNGPKMREMRLTINGIGREYIPECKKCCCFVIQDLPTNRRYSDSKIATDAKENASSAMRYLRHIEQIRNWPLGSIDNISEIQVEPSLPCNLHCPGCPQRDKPKLLKSEGPPYLLDPTLFNKMVDDCKKHEVTIQRIQYCGKGEPTLNKSLPSMIAYAHKHGIYQSMDTNSTHEFKDEYLLLNRMNCSIDGSDKESYNTYRRGGNFDKALEFMARATTRNKELGTNCKIRWKYILFNTTESISQLNRAQEIANQLGIDELDFVITSCGAYDGSVKPTSEFKEISLLTRYIETHKIFNNTVASRA